MLSLPSEELSPCADVEQASTVASALPDKPMKVRQACIASCYCFRLARPDCCAESLSVERMFDTCTRHWQLAVVLAVGTALHCSTFSQVCLLQASRWLTSCSFADRCGGSIYHYAGRGPARAVRTVLRDTLPRKVDGPPTNRERRRLSGQQVLPLPCWSNRFQLRVAQGVRASRPPLPTWPEQAFHPFAGDRRPQEGPR